MLSFSYIIITYLLSILGGLLYFFLIRNKLRPMYQKGMLLSVIAFSFVIPILLGYFTDIDAHASFIKTKVPVVEANANSLLHELQHKEAIESKNLLKDTVFMNYNYVYQDYCPEESEMMICYEQALKEDHFCECEEVAMDNLLKYKERPTYDFVAANESKISSGISLAIGIVLLILGAKIVYLLYLVFTSHKEKLHLDGQTYTILYTAKSLSVGSFLLWKGYIIWQKEMYHLEEMEKKAILWHEISHLQQKDTWLKVGMNVVQTIWFLNPIYYIFLQELERISEYIADEFAVAKVGSVKKYASLLVKMKRQQKLALVHHFKASMLKQRVQYLLNAPPKHTQKRQMIWAIPFLAFTMTCLSVVTSYSLPSVDAEIDKYKLHEKMWKEKNEEGKSLFCKNCLYEEICEEE